MQWLWRLMNAVPPREVGGLILSEERARRVCYSGDLGLLLSGIRNALPRDATLYIEGPRNTAVINVLVKNPARARQKIQVGTLWPRAAAYHVPNDEQLIEHLIELAERMASPEIADHLVVYRGEQVLVSAYDVGDEEVWVSRDLGEDSFRRFLDIVGGTESRGNGA